VLRVFMDHLAAFSRLRLTEEVLSAGLQFYACLQGRLEERLRDLSFCRQRLRHLLELLEAPPQEGVEETNGHRLGMDVTPHSTLPSAEAYWDAIRQTETARLVLPEGETDLDQAAARFLKGLTGEQWTQLDQALQDRVLAAAGGLHKICMTGNDLTRLLSGPLIVEAAATLSDWLPITDVAQVELSMAAARREDLAAQIQAFFTSAAPLVSRRDGAQQAAFLLVPGSDAGKTFGDQACQTLADLELVRVPGQADLMFCREQSELSIADLQRVLHACRRAYEETVSVPNLSPHARFDILDWVPLDP
ncbi:MAG: hypothetical protein JO112_21615, partial [Planctomycetes bacterium]|nr:hypothetical protein [Planctomycetota bacterium]